MISQAITKFVNWLYPYSVMYLQWAAKVMTPFPIRNAWKLGSWLLWPTVHLLFELHLTGHVWVTRTCNATRNCFVSNRVYFKLHQNGIESVCISQINFIIIRLALDISIFQILILILFIHCINIETFRLHTASFRFKISFLPALVWSVSVRKKNENCDRSCS